MQCAVVELYLLAVTPGISKKYNWRERQERKEGKHTAFVCPLVPFRVASYVLRLVLLLLVSLLLAALVEHLFEELELCERYARQREYQG